LCAPRAHASACATPSWIVDAWPARRSDVTAQGPRRRWLPARFPGLSQLIAPSARLPIPLVAPGLGSASSPPSSPIDPFRSNPWRRRREASRRSGERGAGGAREERPRRLPRCRPLLPRPRPRSPLPLQSSAAAAAAADEKPVALQ